MSETTEKIGQSVGIIIGSTGVFLLLVTFIAGGAVLQGFVLKTMWAWFLVPLGLPAVGLAHAIGLGFMVRYLTWQHQPAADDSKKEDDGARIARGILVALVWPLFALGLAWIAHAFM